jgi:hypothetical protein
VNVADSTAPYWSRDVDDVTTSLGSGLKGHTAAHAAERLAVVGPNSVEDAQRLSPLRLFLTQVTSPLVLIETGSARIDRCSAIQWALTDPSSSTLAGRVMRITTSRATRPATTVTAVSIQSTRTLHERLAFR